MALAYVESEDRMVDVDAMIRECKALPPLTLDDGRRIFDKMRQDVLATGKGDMTMEEIDEEIAQCRRERRERHARAMMKESTPASSLVLT